MTVFFPWVLPAKEATQEARVFRVLVLALTVPLVSSMTSHGARYAARQVSHLPPSFGTERVATLGDIAYFASQGQDPVTGLGVGTELWGFDGQDIFLAADIRPGFSSSNPRYLTTFGDAIYFQANDGVRGAELWKYDGSQASLVWESPNGGTSSDPQHFVEWNGQLFFTISIGGGGGAPRRLNKYDGTNVQFISGLVPRFPSENYYVAGQDGFYYALQNGSSFDTYRYDGTSSHFFSPDFGIRPAAFEDDILVVQGGADDTYQLAQLLPSGQRVVEGGFATTRLLPLAEFQGAYYYLGSKPDDPTDLWKYDGLNLVPVASFLPGFHSSYSGHWATDEALFIAIDGEVNGNRVGNEVWAFDGTSLSLVADTYPGPEDSFSHGFFEINGRVHFSAFGPDSGNQIYEIILVPEPESTCLMLLGMISAFLSKTIRR